MYRTLCSCCQADCASTALYCLECGHPLAVNDSAETSIANGSNFWKISAIALSSLTVLVVAGFALSSFTNYPTSGAIPNTGTKINTVSSNAEKAMANAASAMANAANATASAANTAAQKAYESANVSIALPSNLSNSQAPSDIQKKRNEVDTFAVVNMLNANLRVEPNMGSDTIREVEYGEQMKVIGKPHGGWYKVFDPNTNRQGWLHGNTIRLE